MLESLLVPGRSASLPPAVEIMVCQWDEVPRLLSANRNDAEKDRGGPTAWSPSPSSPGGCRQFPWCRLCSRVAGQPLQWRVGNTGAGSGWALGTGGEEELSSSYSSTLRTQSWGRKLDNSGLNKKKAPKRLCATSCPPCLLWGVQGKQPSKVPALSGIQPRALKPATAPGTATR